MKIGAVFFDMGGTIEDIHFNRALQLRGLKEIISILAEQGITLSGSEDSILDKILARNAEYKAWSENNMIESPASQIWNEWNLRDFKLPAEKIDKIAEKLAYTWETSFFHRQLRANAFETLDTLHHKGYKLGIISNTSSRTQVFKTLDKNGIEQFFSCIVLSSIEGIRKPHPLIFTKALKTLGVAAESAAYVGDTLSRDVIGAKRAGFALSFKIDSFMTEASDKVISPGSAKPDFLITDLSEIVPILEMINARSG